MDYNTPDCVINFNGNGSYEMCPSQEECKYNNTIQECPGYNINDVYTISKMITNNGFKQCIEKKHNQKIIISDINEKSKEAEQKGITTMTEQIINNQNRQKSNEMYKNEVFSETQISKTINKCKPWMIICLLVLFIIIVIIVIMILKYLSISPEYADFDLPDTIETNALSDLSLLNT